MCRARFFSEIIFLLSFLVSSISAAAGTLNIFLDYSTCRRASIVNPTIQLAANTCLVSPNAHGVSVKAVPPCLTGRAEIAIYEDTSCTNPSENSDYEVEHNCYYDGSYNTIKAIQFVCPQVESGSVPTATTTVTFGSSLIPIASGEPSSRSETQPTTPSTNTAAVPTSEPTTLLTSPISSPTARNPASSPQSSNVNDDGDGTSRSGISRNAQIGIGIGVPVAALLVAILAWWFPCKKAKRFRTVHHNTMREVPSTGPTLQNNWASHSSPLQDLPADRKYAYH